MNRFAVSFGYRKGRGAWQITEQMLINGKDVDSVYKNAFYLCKRGEEVFDVRLVEGTV